MSKFGKYVAMATILAAFLMFHAALGPFWVAAAAAYILDMPARSFEKFLSALDRPRLRRPLAVAAALVSILAFAVLFISLLAPRIAESAGMLYERLPGYWKALCEYLDALPVPETLRQAAEAREFSLTEHLGKTGAALLSHIWSITRNIGGAVATSVADVFTSIVCCLYMLFCKHSILSQCKALLSAIFPAHVFQKGRALFTLSNEIFTKYISGRVIESLVLMILCLIGLLLSGIPYAPLLSMIVGVSNLIPFLGPLLGTVPCLLLLVVIDPIKALWFTIFVIALQQLDNNVIAPRIVGTSVGLPAFWSMAAVLLGARIYGAAGAFLSVPCAAVAYRVLLKECFPRGNYTKRYPQ